MEELEMKISIIRAHTESDQRLVILQDTASPRYLPIWIGRNEADALAVSLSGIKMERPLTHDLLLNTINELGGSVLKILISKIQNETFYAKVIVRVGSSILELDSRPSDAMALSVRADAPIYVSEAVLDKAGIEKEDEEDTKQDENYQRKNLFSKDLPGPLGKEERQNLAAFESFIESLDVSDLGKSNGDPDDPKSENS